MFRLDLHHQDSGCDARRATFHTPHGPVELPAFMPVATQGTVKGLTIDQVRRTGTEMVLGNTYHLTLRPGEQIIAELGGLHEFMGWNGPILTDSGGFQLFSLAQLTTIREEGALFRSHIDGSAIEITPERAVDIQEALASDIAMVLDHVVPLPNDREIIRDAMERTIRWAERSRRAAKRTNQALFGIVQGGLDVELRVACAEGLVAMDFAGYAIGGLSVGEEPAEMVRIITGTVPALPADHPRYLMGVGRPQDLLEAIRRGIDLFDCVIPTRNGRNALAFTDEGPLRLRNQVHQRDPRPLDAGCDCPACGHSRAYLRHLFCCGEMLGPILLSIHNLTYYQRLLADARRAIEQNRFTAFHAEKCRGWGIDVTSMADISSPGDPGRGV